jgi:hypothetical protein
MFENRLKPLNLSESGTPPASLEARPASSQAGGGKVIHDARGNAVWQWGVATGVFAVIKSNELLSMLDDPSLALEGERHLAGGEWAGDPYNRR